MLNKLSLIVLVSLFTLIFTSCGTESTPVYTLTTSVNGEGTVSPSSGEFEEGETVTLTSTPSQHWVFDNWSGDGSGTSNSITITMDTDKSVVGNFSERLYPLNITVEGEGTVNEEVIQSKSEFTNGTIVQLTPNPSDGWEFVEWSGDVVSTDEIIEVTISGETTINVLFQSMFYLNENGVTIICPDTSPGDKGTVNGTEYESVDRELLNSRIRQETDLTKVCTSLITNMRGLFDDKDFNQSIGNWDVSNVTDMTNMFRSSTFNQPIGDWDVSNVTDMNGMFSFTVFNQNINTWDVSSVTNMGGMFGESQFNQPLGNWDVSKVTEMGWMFSKSSFNQPINDWDVSNEIRMQGMFAESQFNQHLGNWDVSQVTDMSNMFYRSSFNQPINDWDVSKVTDMNNMFSGYNDYITPFNQPIGDWDVSSVTDMRDMFYRSSFNQNISKWCVSNIQNEPNGFSDDSPLTEENKPVWGTCPD